MVLKLCIYKLGGWLIKKFGGHFSDAIIKNDESHLNKILSLLFGVKWYREVMFRNFIPFKYTEKLTPAIKKYLFLYSLSAVLVFSFIFILMALMFNFFVSPLVFDDHGKTISGNALSLLSALGTIGAAVYAARSANAMVVSNRINKESNDAEAFDRRFNTLLEQHNNYLNIINTELKKAELAIFSPGFMNELTLEQGLNILRGENINLVVEDGILSEKNSDDLRSQVSITAGNTFAKNTLSPYMRILYHILKTVKSELGNHEFSVSKQEKKYTNIVRSVIPNDVLFLIALNSVAFYRDKFDIKSLLAYKVSDRIYNDYYKYFFLLRRYAFFEHFSFPVAVDREREFYVSREFARRDLYRFNNLSGRVHAVESTDHKTVFVFADSGINSFVDFMYGFARALKKENLTMVLFAFYALNEHDKSRQILMSKFIHALNYVVNQQQEEQGDIVTEQKYLIKKYFHPFVNIDYKDKIIYLKSGLTLADQLFGDFSIE